MCVCVFRGEGEEGERIGSMSWEISYVLMLLNAPMSSRSTETYVIGQIDFLLKFADC